jgi:hypothetical protein
MYKPLHKNEAARTMAWCSGLTFTNARTLCTAPFLSGIPVFRMYFRPLIQ